MASLIPKKGSLLNYASQAPSPSKDYCQIMVTRTEVIFRWWKITLRKDARVAPGEIRDSLEDFEYDDRLQSEVHRVFGKNMVTYVKGLCQGNIDYFPRMPRPLIIHVIRFLPLEDIARLSQVSKQFQEICESDELWEKIYMDHAETQVTEELRTLAEAIGWKKLFFTNKLQVQVQLRRVNKQLEKGEKVEVDETAFLTDLTETDLTSQADDVARLEDVED